MRIGSFYGFTAPMLVTICNKDIIKILQTFNSRLNSVVIDELKQELYWFSDSLKQIKPVIYLDDSVLTSYEHNASVQNGNIVGSVTALPNSEEIIQSIMDALVDQCAKKLYEKLDERDYDLRDFEDQDSFIKNINMYVEEAMQGKSFALSNYNTLIRAFLKTLKVDNPGGDKERVKNNIKLFCNVKEKLPEQLEIDGELIKLSENELKVIDYYKNSKNIKLLQDNTMLSDYKDDTVFNLSFIDIINRKPTSLYYIIARYFDILKNVDRKLLQNVLDTVNSEYKIFKSFVQDRLYQKDNVMEYITLEQLLESIQDSENVTDSDSELSDFFKDLFMNLNLNVISVEDANKLKCLWYSAQMLQLEYLNESWGTDYTYDSLMKSISVFNKLGIGGINLFTNQLFIESLTDIIFTNGTHVQKSEEYLNELERVCSDIEAFLSTFKPIGGALSV